MGGGVIRVLIVCYGFPPVGGVGVQRAVKLVKYLPEHGVEPAVLTVANPSVPIYDTTYDKDLPEGLEVIRARTFEPGYAVKQAAWSAEADRPTVKQRVMKRATSVAKRMLVPDAQLLWQPAAQLALARRLAERKDDVVLITSPPFSQFLLAPLVRTLGRVPVVLDYRDEWSAALQLFEMLRGGLNEAVSKRLEGAMLRQANAVTVATEAYRENLLRRFSFLDERAVVAISNGYDSDDLPEDLPRPPRDKLVLTYAGTLFTQNSPKGLLGAINRVHEHEPELAELLEVRIYGRIVDTQMHLFEGMEARGVKFLGYVPHAEVFARLAEGHWTLCLLDDVPGCERIYPAKIFELMMLDRPVLTLAPPGVLSDLAGKHQLGEVIAPRDEAAIAAFLVRELRAFRDDPQALRPVTRDDAGIAAYHRRAIAGRFAEVLREVAT